MQDYDPTNRPQDQLGEAEGNTKGDQSAVAKFIERRGPGLVHVAFTTKDINGVLQGLDAEGWRMIDTKGRPGGRARPADLWCRSCASLRRRGPAGRRLCPWS